MIELDIHETWLRLTKLPGGKKLFSKAIGRMAPYSGTVKPMVESLSPGHAVVSISDHKRIRNHLESIHAIALMNLGEMATGLAMLAGLPKGGRGIITGLSMEYVKKARGIITAEAQIEVPQGSGKHDLELEAQLTDEAGDLVARARAVWRLDIP